MSGIEGEYLPKANGHGGARAGAGRKPAGYKKSQETLDFEKARARNEAAKAANAELEFKIKSRQYLARTAIQQASATAIASFSQTMRSVGDNLERKLGLSPEVAEEVQRIVDAALADLANEFELMCGSEPDELDA